VYALCHDRGERRSALSVRFAEHVPGGRQPERYLKPKLDVGQCLEERDFESAQSQLVISMFALFVAEAGLAGHR
jgi:hypothetical protein